MSIVAVVGDCTTTTAVAIAASWPAGRSPVVVECDPTGGSLAAWLDTSITPSLSTIVASTRTGVPDDAGDRQRATGAEDRRPSAAASETDPAATGPFAGMIHESSSGVRFIAAPVRAREAHRVIFEAGGTVFPAMASDPGTIWLADLGRYSPAVRPPRLAELAAGIVIVHRQHTASAAAAAVRLERTAEIADRLGAVGVPIVLVVIGSRPFDIDEIGWFVADEGRLDVVAGQLDDDPFGAAVLAGRTGVSARRAARMPLLRGARRISRLLAGLLHDEHHGAGKAESGGGVDPLAHSDRSASGGTNPTTETATEPTTASPARSDAEPRPPEWARESPPAQGAAV